MSKAEERALEAYPSTSHYWNAEPDRNVEAREFYKQGYNQAEKDLIDKTLAFLKERLYKEGYVGIIDLCDDYIKAMKDDDRKR